ncbi:hypothetical protein [Nocardia farcinica]|uniref:hypothetical protein n=1 Tax=Nocardia farcinica TaxID=37329 RepID=UPI003CC80134
MARFSGRPLARPPAPPPPYLVDLLGGATDLRSRFQEALEVVVASMATPEWCEKFAVDGWGASARLEELGLGL